MSKILEASCVAGVVMIGAIPVPGVTILSEGVSPSTGIVVMQGDEAFYIAKISPDLKSTLETISSTLTTIATTLTAIGAGMTGPTTAPPPTLAVNVAQITTAAAALTTLGNALK